MGELSNVVSKRVGSRVPDDPTSLFVCFACDDPTTRPPSESAAAGTNPDDSTWDVSVRQSHGTDTLSRPRRRNHRPSSQAGRPVRQPGPSRTIMRKQYGTRMSTYRLGLWRPTGNTAACRCQFPHLIILLLSHTLIPNPFSNDGFLLLSFFQQQHQQNDDSGYN